MTEGARDAELGEAARPARYPAIARACFHLDWIFLVFWAIYLLGPDAAGILGWRREGLAYALFSGSFFLIHFVLLSTGIIALFVVIIEIVSFLYFAARFLTQVDRWLGR